MDTMIFVNLPVSDLAKSIAFYTALGYTINPQYTDETAACVVISDHIYVMLLTFAKFQEFTPKTISDARRTSEVLLALSCGSREHVDDLVRRAIAAGGSTYAQPRDYGFMYAHEFQDLDGHIWEVLYMEPDTPTALQ
ncbi:MAG: VOC family protein [Anaerolineae bacterium]